MINPIQSHYQKLSEIDNIPPNHIKYLESLKKNGFEPKVIYDIGSCVLHWTKHAKRLWPDAEIVLFDANPHCTFLYTGYKYYSGILSNISDVTMKFYLNEYSPGGASYYMEIGSPYSKILYSPEKYYQIQSMTLDDVVNKYNFPLPDFVKMDVQGAEYDVLQGSTKVLANAKHLILEIPKPWIEYNKGAPNHETTLKFTESLGWKCTAPIFSDNGEYDGDYGFSR